MDIKNNFPSIEQVTGQYLQQGRKNSSPNSIKEEITFKEVLSNKQETSQEEKLKFSKHANERLASRNIDLTKTQLERLENGTTKAREKGINESLVLVDNLAFIVNVKNNTVVTAVNDKEDKIFTNIDGAVIG